MKSAVISCRPTDKGIHSFYLTYGGESCFLFRQDYRKSVQSCFGSGVCLNDAFRFSKARSSAAVIHTMEKLPAYIRYIEREEDIAVLNRTVKKRTALRGIPA